jgi:Rieske Fe-S protein
MSAGAAVELQLEISVGKRQIPGIAFGRNGLDLRKSSSRRTPNRMNQLLNRREVIKTILVTSACSLIQNKLWAAKVVSDVAPIAASAIDTSVGIARISLASFPALNTNGGSVRLGSSNIQSGNSSPVGLYYPVVISRISTTEYVTLDTQCTHAGYVVGACSGGVNGRMACGNTAPGHGSQYDIRGNPVAGPAQFPLLSYRTSVANGILTAQIFDEGFVVTQKTVLNGSEKRLELSFDGFVDTEYEVRYRTNMTALPTAVSFATSVSGAVTSTVIKGNAQTPTLKVYVVPQDGIYQVAIKWRTV